MAKRSAHERNEHSALSNGGADAGEYAGGQAELDGILEEMKTCSECPNSTPKAPKITPKGTAAMKTRYGIEWNGKLMSVRFDTKWEAERNISEGIEEILDWDDSVEEWDAMRAEYRVVPV